MKDSKKLFLSSAGIIIAGFFKGVAPTMLGKGFDISSFISLCIIAVVVAILGLIKHAKGK